MEKKKKGNGYGTGTFIETSMFLSKAYLHLGKKGTSPVTSYISHTMLMMFLGKRVFEKVRDRKGIQGKHLQTDENKFTLTYKELESRGIKQNVASRGFKELLAKGFISIVDPGGAFEKHKAVYALEETYLLWNPIHKQVFYERERDIRRGYQGAGKQVSHTPEGDTHTHPRGGHPTQRTHTPGGDTPILNKTRTIA